MKLADWITLAVVGVIVVAFIMGRRNAKRAVAAALAAARAEGHAEATAAAASNSTSGVFISGANGADADSLASVVAKILAEHSAANHSTDNDDDYDYRAAINDTSGVSGRRALPAAYRRFDNFGVGAVQDSARRDETPSRGRGRVVVDRGRDRGGRDIPVVEAKEVTDL